MDKPTILFVCVHNAGRSRMAETFLIDIAGDRYAAASAGTIPAEHPHPEVVMTMKELGITIPDTPGTLLTPEMTESALRVIGMGCNVQEACPAIHVPLEDWALDDPKGKPHSEVRRIRDDIKARVAALVDELDK